MVILLMGVAGVGKTTIGRELARQLGWTFLDADEDHPPGNVDRMRAGIPLTDADRLPWLAAVRARVRRHVARGDDVVLACSALRQAHRDYLSQVGDRVAIVQLTAPEALVRSRISLRPDHFMPADLLDSQYQALEQPAHAVVIDAATTVAEAVATIRARLDL